MPFSFQYLRQPNIEGTPPQSTGAELDARRTVPIAIDVSNGDVYPMHGTSVSDVPTPATIASKKQYVPITGRGNSLNYTEEIVEEARNTSYTRTLLTPPHSPEKKYGKKAMLNILYDKQRRGCEFVYFGYQEIRDCDPCTAYINRWGVGRLTKPITVNPETINWTAPDGSVPLAVQQSTAETSGEMVEYTPLIPYLLEDGFTAIDADIDLYTISSYSGNQCTECLCPTENFAIGGQQDDPAEALVVYTTDGGVSFTQITATAFVVAQPILKLLDLGQGRLVAFGGSTTKEAGYSDNGNAFIASDLSDVTNAFRTAVLAGSKIITGGNAGAFTYSCDRGLSFHDMFFTTGADPILSMAYDPETNLIWAIDNSGVIMYFTPDATEETDASLYANPNSAATTKGRIFVLDADHVVAYLDDQTISESYNARSNQNWEVQSIGLQTNEDIVRIWGDAYRMVVTTDMGRVLQRDLSTNGVFKAVQTGGVNSADFDSGTVIRALYGEEDTSGNYAQSFFIFADDSGFVWRLEDCVPCRLVPFCS